jgi:hypothetical protein
LKGGLVVITKKCWALSLVFTFLMAGTAWAATATANLTINAVVTATAKLALGVAAINFPNADPDTTLKIPANENGVSVTAQGKTTHGSTITLTVLAGGDLVGPGGSTPIPISKVTWKASGLPFVDGTMSKAGSVSAGSWTSSGSKSGSFDYFLDNSWDYDVGSYTATCVYTLTAP